MWERSTGEQFDFCCCSHSGLIEKNNVFIALSSQYVIISMWMFSRYTSINSINLHIDSPRWLASQTSRLLCCLSPDRIVAGAGLGTRERKSEVIDGLGKRQLGVFLEINVVTHHHQLWVSRREKRKTCENASFSHRSQTKCLVDAVRTLTYGVNVSFRHREPKKRVFFWAFFIICVRRDARKEWKFSSRKSLWNERAWEWD